ncbi:MAG: glycosyltransferase family 4 protein, partial [bacterium]|nr:glycosyltransferase family 4 protein [bacterium]
ENLEAKLPEFDCLVLASDSEPFGLVLLEAMRAGVPVIATRAGGVPEIVRHGHDGLLFDPGDHETLARHLIRLAGDRAVARELAEHGLETLEERFSVAAQARGVAAVFANLAQPPAR